MMQLKLDYDRMGIRDRDDKRKWEWFKAQCSILATVHIHNKTESGKWTWVITASIATVKTRSCYTSRDLAYQAALGKLDEMLLAGREEIQNTPV